MLKRLRKKHPIGYCVGAEVIFLGVMMLASFILTLGLVLFCDDLSGIEDYLLTALQELAGVAEEFLFRAIIGQTLLEHFGTSRAGIWKACIVSGLLFGAAHLTNLLSSEPFGVLMQCVFAASLGVLLTAIYYRTGNIWVTVFIHAAMDISSMLIGGLYGTENVVDTVSSYDASMLFSVVIYLVPTVFLLRKKKISEVQLYFGKDMVTK